MTNAESAAAPARLRGDLYHVVEPAVAVLERSGRDIRQYTISVVEDGGPVVMFSAAEHVVAARDGALLTEDALRALGDRTRGREPRARFAGASFPALRAAVPVFLARVADLAPYEIEVVRDGDSMVVVFADHEAPRGGRGSLGSRPGFEVELDASLQVLGSSFVR